VKGIDCATQITQKAGQELVKQGINYVARYLVPDWPSMTWKRLTKEEVQILTALGIKILSIFETSANRPQGGAEAGAYDGQLAYNETQLIGQPTGTAVFFAVDYDAGPADYDLIEQYLRAAAEQLPGYKIGVYGSFYVVEEMARRKACDYFWQTSAWSGNNIPVSAHVYQYEYGVQIAGIQTDINDFYFDYVCWNLDTPPVEQEVKALDWKTIIQKISNNPDEWKNSIEVVVNAAKAEGDLGALEIFAYLPQLIEKVYSEAKAGRI
jgi:hypothetical protein